MILPLQHSVCEPRRGANRTLLAPGGGGGGREEEEEGEEEEMLNRARGSGCEHENRNEEIRER